MPRRNFFHASQQKKWEDGVYKNPYFEPARRDWKKPALVVACVAAALAVLFFFLFTSLLRLQTYHVEGAEFLRPEEVASVARESTRGRWWLIVPKDHILFFSEEQMTEELFRVFRLDQLEVRQEGRDVVIRLSEKVSRVVWMSGEASYVVDEHGVVVSRMEADPGTPPTTLTVIRSLSEETIAVGDQVLEPNTIAHILELILLVRKSPLSIASLEIDSREAHFLRVNLTDGYAVFFDPTASVEEQFDRLLTVLRSETADPSTYEYVDVRFGERVYIKDR